MIDCSSPTESNTSRLSAIGLALVLSVVGVGLVSTSDARASGPSAATKTLAEMCPGIAATATLKSGDRASDLSAKLRVADIILLGEIHDNPIHHKLQACLLATAVGGAARPAAVVWEQIRVDQADRLRDAVAGLEGPLDQRTQQLGAALKWDKSGWPAWELYAPIARVALDAKLPMRAGDAPRAIIRAVARKGVSALDPAERARLGLDAPLPGAEQKRLLDELAASHCGLMPASAFANMSVAQRLRDAHLAAALVSAHRETGRAVLIAGNGHVRSDRGVPWHLARTLPDARVVTVWMSEQTPGTAAAPTVPKGANGEPAADLVLTAAPPQRPDPCEQMRKQFGAKKKK